MKTLFCFGLGYSAKEFAGKLYAQGWRIQGTSRTMAGCDQIRKMGFEAFLYDGCGPTKEILHALNGASHLLLAIAPPEGGDPVLQDFANVLKGDQFDWVGYLSTVGVYGDHQGRWIDEDAALRPKSERSLRRVAAENGWRDLAHEQTLPVHIFRLSGIYGPGRSPIDNLKQGRARRIVKDGQVFNRIHVADIAAVLQASLQNPRAGAIYNVTDSEPAPPQDVVTFAAKVLQMEPPPLVAFDDADLSPMGRSFYGENKRVSNERVRLELGVELSYPTYREGVRALARGAGIET